MKALTRQGGCTMSRPPDFRIVLSPRPCCLTSFPWPLPYPRGEPIRSCCGRAGIGPSPAFQIQAGRELSATSSSSALRSSGPAPGGTMYSAKGEGRASERTVAASGREEGEIVAQPFDEAAPVAGQRIDQLGIIDVLDRDPGLGHDHQREFLDFRDTARPDAERGDHDEMRSGHGVPERHFAIEARGHAPVQIFTAAGRKSRAGA